MQETLSRLTDQLRSLWRFRWPAVLVAWVVCLLGWAVVFMIPSRYNTQARLYVDTNSLLKPLLEGIAVQPNTTGETELVRNALLGRPRIAQVIDQTDMHLRAKNETDRQRLINQTSEKISFWGEGEKEARIFTISYTDTDAGISYSVVKMLVDMFRSESIGGTRNESEAAQEFLVKQIRQYEDRLTSAEQKLAEFKKQNIGLMPDEKGGYFERLQAAMQSRDQLARQLNILKNKREEIRKQLSGESAVSNTATSGIDARITETQSKLDELLLRFTESHPDVIATRETLEQLKANRAKSPVLEADEDGSPVGRVGQSLQIALNQTDVDMTTMRTQIQDLDSQIAQLRAMMNVLPEVEAKYSQLNRDYAVTKAAYQALVDRLDRARISDAADKSQDTRIRVISPPVYALFPSSPPRSIMLLAVLLAGLGAGVAAAILLAQLRPVVLRASSVSKIIDLPILGTIDLLTSPQEVSHARRQYVLVGLVACTLVLASGAIIVLRRFGESAGHAVLHQLGIV